MRNSGKQFETELCAISQKTPTESNPFLLSVIIIITCCYHTVQVITVVMHMREEEAGRIQLPAHQQLLSCHRTTS